MGKTSTARENFDFSIKTQYFLTTKRTSININIQLQDFRNKLHIEPSRLLYRLASQEKLNQTTSDREKQFQRTRKKIPWIIQILGS